MKLARVISGSQSGADQAGLRAARAAGFETGGYVTVNCMTEDGPRPDLIAEYGLEELQVPANTPLDDQYRIRTRLNVAHSDATLLFYKGMTPGTKAMLKAARELGRPVGAVVATGVPPDGVTPFRHDDILGVASWVIKGGFEVLNVAGPRASAAPKVGKFAEDFLYEVFVALKFFVEKQAVVSGV